MKKNELKLKVDFPKVYSKVSFGHHFALNNRLPKLIQEIEGNVALITDKNVEKILATQIEHLNVKIFSFSSGEMQKIRETKAFLEDTLLTHNFGRDSCIVGLGGGVVSDLVGFLAATYCRGIPWIQIPTTLMAMVDASIGGKTGVNTPYGKNMIGSFFFPQNVLIDTKLLDSLPTNEWINGVVEIIKYALIKSPSLFQLLYENKQKWEERDPDFIKQIISQSVSIKSDVVKEDPFEKKGKRRILNFGHTFGHALETLEDYQIDHGVAVAIGMMVAAFISQKLHFLSQEEFDRIYEILKMYQVPMILSKAHQFKDLLATLALDKKAKNTSPRMVLLKKIGHVHPFEGDYCTEIPLGLLQEATSWMNQEFAK